MILINNSCDVRNFNNNNNNNEFRVRFGVRRRHRGPPFAYGHHQSVLTGGDQGRRGEREGGYTSRVSYFRVSVREFSKSMKGKDVFLRRRETKVRSDRIEVQVGENSKWMGLQMKMSVGHLQTECQGQ